VDQWKPEFDREYRTDDGTDGSAVRDTDAIAIAACDLVRIFVALFILTQPVIHD
jgi:hypothetical protein